MKKTIIIKTMALIIIVTLLNGCSNYTNYNKVDYESMMVDKIDYNVAFNFGDLNSKTKVIIYSSLECPDCQILHNNSKNILSNFINHNKIRLVFKLYLYQTIQMIKK